MRLWPRLRAVAHIFANRFERPRATGHTCGVVALSVQLPLGRLAALKRQPPYDVGCRRLPAPEALANMLGKRRCV